MYYEYCLGLPALCLGPLLVQGLSYNGRLSVVSGANTAHKPHSEFVLGWATSTTPHSTASDPAEVQASQYLEQGTQKLEEGDTEAAKALYKSSVDIKRTASSLFNLGVTHYLLSKF